MERVGVNSPEDRTLTGDKITFAPPITASELLGKKIKEPKDLNLAKRPIYLAKMPTATGTTEYLAIVDRRLRVLGLQFLLQSVAPGKKFTLDRRDIINDWKLPDQTDGNEQNTRLVGAHVAALGENWSAFEEHRLLFLWTLNYDWDEHLPWLIENGELFKADVVGSPDQVDLRKDCRFLPHEDVNIEILDERKIALTFAGFARAELVSEPSKYKDRWHLLWTLLEETCASTNYLIPTIRWRKKPSGERSWNFEFFDKQTAYSLVETDSLPQGLQFDYRRLNPLVGLLTVAHCSPALTALWPKRQKFIGDQIVPSRQHGQFMGPAQVPVVALQFRDQLLESPFLEAAESYLDSAVR